MNREKLEQKLVERKDEIGLVNTRLDFNKVSGDEVSASIHQSWKYMDINYGDELNLVPDVETERFCSRVGIEDADLVTGKDLVDHEVGHRENPAGNGKKRGCPYDVKMHDSIKQAIFEGLREKGKQGMTNYVTNAFEDVLDDLNCRTQTDYFGKTLFWNHQGLNNAAEGKYSPFYEAFVKIGLVLGGDVKSYGFLKRFFSNSEDVKTAQNGFLSDVKSELDLESIVRLQEKEEFDDLFTLDMDEREKLWTGLAYSFAKNTADLLEDIPPREKMFGSFSDSDENSDEHNPFDVELQIPFVAEEIALGRYKSGKGKAPMRESKEELFNLYRAISKEIEVKTVTYSDFESMPLVYFGRKEFSEEDKKLRFRGLGVNEKGGFFIKTTKHSIEYPASYKTHPRNFPKFKLCLMDRSFSMGWNPEGGRDVGDTSFIPWGDNSRYHYALKGRFGIDNFLERQGIAPYVRDAVLGWSGEEVVRGDYKTVSKSLLVKPKGGTSFDIGGLEKEFEKDAFVMSISDTEVSLDDDEKERLGKKMDLCDYSHVQIGYKVDSEGNIIKNDYCEFVESKGKPVLYVKGDDDLSNAMVGFVSGYYKGLKEGKIQK